MAILRDQPYGNQHFLVDLGSGTDGPEAGFLEVVLPDISVDVIEYRSGNDRESGRRKLPGLAHYSNLVLRRGFTGSLSLYSWMNEVRNGNVNTRRTVTILLLSEDQATVVAAWKALRSFPVKYSASDLNGAGTDIVIEELVLSCERVELE